MLTIPSLAPDGLDAVKDTFGDPHLQLVDGAWKVDPRWEATSCGILYHPILPMGRIYCHVLVQAPLHRLLDRWKARQDAGDTYKILTFGCFNPRMIRGAPTSISMHSFAIAFDLNAATNPMVVCEEADPRRATGRDIPDDWDADAIAEGWFSGRNFKHRYDPQHYQFATGC